jgi:hypothetical protein
MAATLLIQDGNPVWLSPSIVPSKDTVIPTSLPPTLATVHVSSNDVYVYVKVENNGTVGFGGCSCSALGAWNPPPFFSGFFASKTLTKTDMNFGVTFTAGPSGDSLSGAVSKFIGISASGIRAWAWSPDGRYFAYVGSPNGPDWFLTIYALQDITRPNGTTVAKGQVAAQANGLYAGNFGPTTFGWAGSKAVVSAGKGAGGTGIARSVTCPEAPAGATWGETVPDFPGQLDWSHLVSPCASVVAIVPKILLAAIGSRNAYLVSTATAALTPFKKNNVSTTVTITGANPSISTTAHAANGVSVVTGSGTITVDDPDCTAITTGVTVHVDRVKASTLPSANLGVVSVGTAVAGPLPVGGSRWAQVPPPIGWANQTETHWCLLAQAYTSDNTTIPVAWNGQAAAPPPFPLGSSNCAQRNIDIVP